MVWAVLAVLQAKERRPCIAVHSPEAVGEYLQTAEQCTVPIQLKTVLQLATRGLA